MELIALGVVYVVGIIVNAVIADAKGREPALAVLMSIFLSPVFAYLYLLAVPCKKAQALAEQQNQHLAAIAMALAPPAPVMPEPVKKSSLSTSRNHRDFL